MENEILCAYKKQKKKKTASSEGVYEPQREKRYLRYGDQSLRSPPEETLHPWLSTMRPVKIMNRLLECTESSPVHMPVFWRCGSYNKS